MSAVDLRDNRLCELCVELRTEKKARIENVQTYIGILDQVPHDSTRRDDDDSSDQGKQRSNLYTKSRKGNHPAIQFELLLDSPSLGWNCDPSEKSLTSRPIFSFRKKDFGAGGV